MKLKVKPSFRTKRRYILFEGRKESVEKAIKDGLGILGWAKASPIFIKNNILSISREQVENARAAFELSSENIKIKRVSGTLKGVAK